MAIGWEWTEKEENKRVLKENKEKVIASLKKTEKVLEGAEGKGKELVKNAKKKHDSLVEQWGGF